MSEAKAMRDASERTGDAEKERSRLCRPPLGGDVAARRQRGEPLPPDAKARGDLGENITAQYLTERGFEILARQWRCRYGELDLIARDSSGVIRFVEVKLRKRGGIAGREAVDAKKQERLRKTALCWLSENDPDAVTRFDVAEIRADPDGLFRLDYISDAFA